MKNPNLMMDAKKGSAIKQIKTLMLVLGSGVAFAFIITVAMLYKYNPSGAYLAKYVLLSPENIESMHFFDININSSTSKESNLAFEKIEFTYYDTVQKKWVEEPIDMKKYGEFYEMIGNDKGLPPLSNDLNILFSISQLATLYLKVNYENNRYTNPNSSSKNFLVVDFAENYYRTQLRVHKMDNPWVYFYHPEISFKVRKLFLNDL